MPPDVLKELPAMTATCRKTARKPPDHGEARPRARQQTEAQGVDARSSGLSGFGVVLVDQLKEVYFDGSSNRSTPRYYSRDSGRTHRRSNRFELPSK